MTNGLRTQAVLCVVRGIRDAYGLDAGTPVAAGSRCKRSSRPWLAR